VIGECVTRLTELSDLPVGFGGNQFSSKGIDIVFWHVRVQRTREDCDMCPNVTARSWRGGGQNSVKARDCTDIGATVVSREMV
jgi:hypothetical protein